MKRVALRKRLNNRKEKHILSDKVCDLAEVVPKNIFKFGKKTFKQKRKNQFLGKQNVNLISGRGILMIHFYFQNMEKKNLGHL